MKKTIFTICSAAALCAVIFLACTKEDNGNKQVSYSSQPGYGGGNNPNPNNNPSSSGNTTTNTNTVTACTKSLTLNNSACGGSLSSSISGNTLSLSATSPATMVMIAFPGTGSPASGTYSIVTGSPAGFQCTFACNPGGSAAIGAVTITTGSSNKAIFSGVVCGTNTVSGTACY